MTPSFSMRRATDKDAGALVSVFRDGGLLDERQAHRLRGVLEQRLETSSTSTAQPAIGLLATASEAPIGALYATENGMHAFLSHVAVMKDWRDHGVGQALHAELVRVCTARKLAGIIADSWLTSAGFFHTLGYRTPGAVFLMRDLDR